MKAKKLVLLLPFICLLGCYSGSVKPLLNRPEFKAENEPIRTLRILLITDDAYRKNEIEKFVSKCSRLVEMQVGMRLEIVDGYEIKWEDELDDIIKMEIRIAADTWSKRDQFDIALTFVYFIHIALLAVFIAASAIDLELWIIPLSICWFVTAVGVVGSAIGGYIVSPQALREYSILPVASPGTGALALGAAVGFGAQDQGGERSYGA
jgi:hypothetical protein